MTLYKLTVLVTAQLFSDPTEDRHLHPSVTDPVESLSPPGFRKNRPLFSQL